MIGERNARDELCMVYEVMRGLKCFMHVEAFDTMVWHGRKVSCPRLLVGISIYFAACINQTSPNSTVSCHRSVQILGSLP